MSAGLIERQRNFDKVMRDINSLGEGTPEWHEAMWFLLSVMARRQAILADSKRRSIRDSERRRAARKTRPIPPGSGAAS